MNLTVFGANGRVGQNVIKYALENGHKVKAFVRSAANIDAKNIEIVEGNVLDFEAVNAAMADTDIVISALGARNFLETITLMSDGMKNIALAMYNHDVERVLAIGGAGILQETEKRLRMEHPDFPQNFLNVSNDHLRVYKILEASSFSYTIVCPPYMPNDLRTGKYRTLANYFPDGGLKVSAEDVADFLVNEMVLNKFERQRVGITY